MDVRSGGMENSRDLTQAPQLNFIDLPTLTRSTRQLLQNATQVCFSEFRRATH